MIFKQIQQDLATTRRVLREFRAALERGSLLDPSEGLAGEADAPSGVSLADLGFPQALRYVSAQFLIVFAAGLLTLHAMRVIPEERIGPEERMIYLTKNPDRFDIIMIGSSRMRIGLPVVLFDEHLRSHGLKLKPTFNMGIADASMHQNFYTIRRLLDAGVRPRYLFVEAAPFTSVTKGSRIRRVELWHDLEETIRVLKSTVEEPRPPGVRQTRLKRAWTHLQYFLRKKLLLGRMLRFNTMLLPDQADPLYIERRGYKPIHRDGQSDHLQFQPYLDNPSLWDERIAALEAGYDGDYPKPVNLEGFEDLIEYVNSKGVKLIFVGTPFSEIGWVEPLLWLEQEGLVSSTGNGEDLPLFLNFNLPSIPYVRDFDLRFDEGHTSNEGAEMWAEDLARAFVEALGIEGPPETVRPGDPEPWRSGSGQ